MRVQRGTGSSLAAEQCEYKWIWNLAVGGRTVWQTVLPRRQSSTGKFDETMIL